MPQPVAPCIRVTLPSKPALLPSAPANDAINIAAMLGYLSQLEHWARVVSESCTVKL